MRVDVCQEIKERLDFNGYDFSLSDICLLSSKVRKSDTVFSSVNRKEINVFFSDPSRKSVSWFDWNDSNILHTCFFDRVRNKKMFFTTHLPTYQLCKVLGKIKDCVNE